VVDKNVYGQSSRTKSAPSGTKSRAGVLSRIYGWINIGVDPESAPARVRWVQTINIVAFTSMFLCLVFTGFYASLDFESLWPVAVANLVCFGGYGLGLFQNSQGRPRRAAWIMLGAGWANTAIPGAALGVDTGVYLFLILVPMLGVLVSAPGDRLMQAVVVGFGALIFAAVPVWFPRTPESVSGTSVETVLFVSSALVVVAFGALVVLYYRTLVDTAEAALAEANERSERLLVNMLPPPIAERLKAGEFPIADKVDEVTVLFADLVDSTHLAERVSADELVDVFNRIFSEFDDISDRFGLEKIATIGDAYFAVAGLPVPREDHIEAAAEAALAMRSAVRDLSPEGFGELGVRFGMCTGPVVAGVIGRRKFRYDLWGDTVNMGSRMQSHGEPGAIHVTEGIQSALGDRYVFHPRGAIDVKGKGLMNTYFLLHRRPEEPEEPVLQRPASEPAALSVINPSNR
jgi:class 3 adenylate cyclase